MAAIDLLSLLGPLLTLIGNKVGGTFAQLANSIAAGASGLMGLANLVIAWETEGAWWMSTGITVTADILITDTGGPISILFQLAMAVAKPIIGHLIDAGGHFLTSLGSATYAEEDSEKNMPIDQWCTLYGGGC